MTYNTIDGCAVEHIFGDHTIEFTYSKTTTHIIPRYQYPRNNWGYSNPKSSNGLKWCDIPPKIKKSKPYLWRSQRYVSGVKSRWTTPQIVAKLGT